MALGLEESLTRVIAVSDVRNVSEKLTNFPVMVVHLPPNTQPGGPRGHCLSLSLPLLPHPHGMFGPIRGNKRQPA